MRGSGIKIGSQFLDKRKKLANERESEISTENLLKLKFVTAIITNNNELYNESCNEVRAGKFIDLKFLLRENPREIRTGGIGA
jgi:hypothetical protein